MKITDAKQGFGNKIARSAQVDRSAYRSAGSIGVALADAVSNVAGTAADTFKNLKLAEEQAKAEQLRTDYEVEYNTKLNQLDEDYKNNNYSASDLQKKQQTILDDLESKYKSVHKFETHFGDDFNKFIEKDKFEKAKKFQPTVNEVAMKNQAISWAKGETNRLDAAISGDYQTMQNMIKEQTTVYASPQYQVAFGEKAVYQKQKFIDQANVKWMKTQLEKGSDPNEMLDNLKKAHMFVDVSEDVKTNMAVSLKQEIKRRNEQAKKAAKENAKEQVISSLANGIKLTGGLNPKDKNHRKAFNQILKEEVSHTNDPNKAMEIARNTRIEYGYIENDEVSSITAAFNSNDENKISYALQSVDNYISSNPRLAEYFNDDIVQTRNLMKSGYDVATAIDMHNQLNNLSNERKETLKEQLKDKDMLNNKVNDISEAFEEKWDVDSTLGIGGWNRPEELERIAEKVYKEQYVFYNGNSKAAEEGTNMFLLKNYGVTEIGKEKRIMFQSPGTYIRMRSNIEFEPQEIREVFLTDLINEGIPENKAAEAEIYRVPSNDKKGNPQYQVLINGQPLLNKSGNNKLWTFDVDFVLNKLKEKHQSEIKSVIDEERANKLERIRIGSQRITSVDKRSTKAGLLSSDNNNVKPTRSRKRN